MMDEHDGNDMMDEHDGGDMMDELDGAHASDINCNEEMPCASTSIRDDLIIEALLY